MTPRPAATLIVVRQGRSGPEVLMLERSARGFFGGLWVFPGGGVEAIDDSVLARRAVVVPDDCDDFPWRAAALRETIEEVGLCLADPPDSAPVSGVGDEIYRRAIEAGVRLDGGRLRLLSQWITPVDAPTRFDARFYLAVIDDDPVLTAQSHEVVSMTWTAPRAALERGERQEWALIFPTIHHLDWLARFGEVSDMWAAASRATGERVEPIVERDGSEVRLRLPAGAELP